MKILAVECSASPASAAILEDGKTKALFYTNSGLVHSKTLVPMLSYLLECSGLKLSQIDLFALTTGPGSFTGLRIGAAALKGLSTGLDDCCIGVSALEAIAYNFYDMPDCLICSCMDARNSRSFAACFEAAEGKLKRLSEDRVLSFEELVRLTDGISKGRPLILAGDGAELCFNGAFGSEEARKKNILLAPEQLRFQNAASVARCAAARLEQGEKACCGSELRLEYMCEPQALRELRRKKQ